MLENVDILEENEIKPTTEKSKSINAINKQTVHQICSGQVVLNLATAIKELVENSLDAGATAIEIKLKEYGKESVEVSDNGHGVEEENFQALTLKHHTSKLRDYSDLIGVGTFGFRGEALSSLCALSNVTIITRHKSVECGTRIEFDHNGIIMKKSPCARQIGTTVSLANIFSTLPVRQKEFHKNIKREFNKMTQLLYAYCLVANHAKITCSNQNKGNRTIVVSTQGNKGLRDNIVSVFGSKQIQGLIDIKPSDTFIIESDEDPANNTQKKTPFEFEGVISSCDHDYGRSSADRQFYYINSRPCEPNKIMKVVNEVYKQYNTNQYPFIFLNIKVESQDVDVNVTPDKRQIFLNHEKLLLSLLKQTLIKLFENIPSTMKIQNKSLDTSAFNQLTFVGNSMNNLSKKSSMKIDECQGMKRKISFLERFTSSSKNIKLSHDIEQEIDTEVILSTPIEDAKTPDLSSDSENEIRSHTNDVDLAEGEFDIKQKFENFFKNKYDSELSCKNNPVYMPKNVTVFHENHKMNKKEDNREEFIKNCSPDNISSKNIATNSQNMNDINSDSEINSVKSESDTVKYDSSEDNTPVKEKKTLEDVDFINNMRKNTVEMKYSLDDVKSIMKYQGIDNIKSEVDIVVNHDSSEEDQNAPVQEEILSKDNFIRNIKRKTVTMKCSLDDIKSRMKCQAEAKSNLNKSRRIKFRSEILPSTNESAEKELDREISKEMFSKMIIIGQFNLGFIIVKFEDDLFIIDQHASDEKYNFESLQKSTVLQYQKLVIPQPLELTAVNESILMDNIDVFERNGFKFEINESADTTRRVKLIGIPISKNVQFGKEDIDELLFMLQDYSGDNASCRPSRVRSMFASRACRKSVMVGTPMTKTDMRKLVDNMGTMEQPWNCPHGRPTMRHLVNLFLLNKSSEE